MLIFFNYSQFKYVTSRLHSSLVRQSNMLKVEEYQQKQL